jgi:hypothetical protein
MFAANLSDNQFNPLGQNTAHDFHYESVKLLGTLSGVSIPTAIEPGAVQ